MAHRYSDEDVPIDVVLYSDEDVPIRVVHVLRQLGHEVRTALEEGQANRAIDDDAVLAYAVRRGWAVLTRNRRHYKSLHRRFPDHHGIITITHDPDPDALAARIDQRIRMTLASAGTLNRQLIPIVKPPR